MYESYESYQRAIEEKNKEIAIEELPILKEDLEQLEIIKEDITNEKNLEDIEIDIKKIKDRIKELEERLR